jgi:hypothetical protein
MNLNPQQLRAIYRDWWPQYNPNSVALLEGINRSHCYVPRFFVAPSGGNLSQNVQAPQSYVNFVLEIPPGSFVYGFYHGSIQNFTMQVTDLGLGYKWFNTPIPDSVFLSDPGGPYLLPAPYPVMSPGTLFFEFYSTVALGGSSTNLAMTVGVAVPVEAVYHG